MNRKIEAIRLSSLFTNPSVKAAFERVERDNGAALVVPAPVGPRFIGGAGASLLAPEPRSAHDRLNLNPRQSGD